MPQKGTNTVRRFFELLCFFVAKISANGSSVMCYNQDPSPNKKFVALDCLWLYQALESAVNSERQREEVYAT